MPDEFSQLRASIAALESWGHTSDRTKRTAPARAALDAKFLDQADGDPKRAECLRKAYYKRLALKSVQARRRTADEKARQADLIAVKAELSAQLAEVDAELDAAGGAA